MFVRGPRWQCVALQAVLEHDAGNHDAQVANLGKVGQPHAITDDQLDAIFGVALTRRREQHDHGVSAAQAP